MSCDLVCSAAVEQAHRQSRAFGVPGERPVERPQLATQRDASAIYAASQELRRLSRFALLITAARSDLGDELEAVGGSATWRTHGHVLAQRVGIGLMTLAPDDNGRRPFVPRSSGTAITAAWAAGATRPIGTVSPRRWRTAIIPISATFAWRSIIERYPGHRPSVAHAQIV